MSAGVTSTPAQTGARSATVLDTSIRVDVGLLDTLMDQIGELVLARNRLMQYGPTQEDRGILAVYQRLDLLTTELQESVMKARMQPIGTIWNRLPRVVRDLALECGKKVSVTMDGQETELDRTLNEAIKDPLTHLIRNAVDHGIETPEARLQIGKPETGTHSLRAFHEGGQVNIEIADDGNGIDPERIVQKAIDRNLITNQQATQMSQREILNLIFTPGFSTAETITSVSGRGVGMDVVKNNIEKISGSIDMQSQLGQGTTIKVKIPLTLAIIPALIVQCVGDRYAIPQANLIELVHLSAKEALRKIETLYEGVPVYRLRGKLLPLVYLNHELGLDIEGPSQRPRTDARHAVDIVVLQAEERQFGLVVDSVNDTEEIVVKPLSKQLSNLAVFSGATIMGDGKVALILDVLGLAEWAQVVSKRLEVLQVDATEQPPGQMREQQSFLLFESGVGERLALSLSQVTRLEKIPQSRVEQVGHRKVIQYREQVMALIDLSQVLGGQWALPTHDDGRAKGRETLEVIVHRHGHQYIGLVVDRILDVVEDRFAIQELKSHEGVQGTVVVQGQVVELLDLEKLIQIADPMLLEQLKPVEAKV